MNCNEEDVPLDFNSYKRRCFVIWFGLLRHSGTSLVLAQVGTGGWGGGPERHMRQEPRSRHQCDDWMDHFDVMRCAQTRKADC